LIGSLLSSSGPLVSLGKSARHGARLAAELLSPPGELLGHRIEWVDKDDQCGPKGHYGARELAIDVEVAFVIGTTCSDAALGWADTIFSETGIVLISPTNTSPANTDPALHQPFYFRVIHNDRTQAAAMAEFAFNQLGARWASTINDDTPHSFGMQEEFTETFRELGGLVAAQERVNLEDTKIRPLLRAIANDEVDFLYLPIQVDETFATTPLASMVTNQARKIPQLRSTILARSNGLTQRIGQVASDHSEDMYVSDVALLSFEQDAFYNEKVRPAYEERFGEKPTSADHAYAFDAARLVFEAIVKVAIQTPEGGLLIPRTRLRDAVYATRDFRGITGRLTCNKNGDCQPEATITIHRVRSGDFGAPLFKKTVRLKEI
jgi:branched-chain amino acid transport system substrate-binding protein